MPLHFFYLNQKTITALFSLAFLVIFTTFATPAHADPHAVFYTDRAQEQLFYNVLAALNQADYVEPGILGSPYSRASLVQNRDIASNPVPGENDQNRYGPETNPVLNATRTNLPSVVTRNITLEGNDVWTAYQLQQFALEVDTRRAASELIRIFCTNGIGLAGCDTNPGAEQTKNATNPLTLQDYLNGPSNALISGLMSGTQSEKDLRDILTGTGIGSNQFKIGTSGPSHPGPESLQPNLPRSAFGIRPNSAPIASLRKNNENNNNALGIINTITSTILAAKSNSTLDPNVFSNIAFTTNNQGVTTANIKEGLSFNDYMNTLAGISNLVPGILEEASRASEQGQQFQQLQQNTPSLAQGVYTKEENGGVKYTVTVPSSQVAEQASQAIALLGNETLAQKSATANDIQTPGLNNVLTNKKLNIPAVAGISTTNPSLAPPPQSSGQVAGIVDIAQKVINLYTATYDTPDGTKVKTNPNTPLDSSIKEPGNRELLQAISGSNRLESAQNTTCGFCANMDNIIGNTTSAGKAVLTAYQDTICYFFPTVSGCIASNTKL